MHHTAGVEAEPSPNQETTQGVLIGFRDPNAGVEGSYETNFWWLL